MCERRDRTLSRHLIFDVKISYSLYQFQSIRDLTLIYICTTHPPLKYSIPLLKKENTLESFCDKFRHVGQQNMSTAAWYAIKIPLVGTTGSGNSKRKYTFPFRKTIPVDSLTEQNEMEISAWLLIRGPPDPHSALGESEILLEKNQRELHTLRTQS